MKKAEVSQLLIYRELKAEQDEVLKHKWIESEKLGYDIGMDRARFEWITKFKSGWRRSRGWRQRSELTPKAEP